MVPAEGIWCPHFSYGAVHQSELSFHNKLINSKTAGTKYLSLTHPARLEADLGLNDNNSATHRVVADEACGRLYRTLDGSACFAYRSNVSSSL